MRDERRTHPGGPGPLRRREQRRTLRGGRSPLRRRAERCILGHVVFSRHCGSRGSCSGGELDLPWPGVVSGWRPCLPNPDPRPGSSLGALWSSAARPAFALSLQDALQRAPGDRGVDSGHVRPTPPPTPQPPPSPPPAERPAWLGCPGAAKSADPAPGAAC